MKAQRWSSSGGEVQLATGVVRQALESVVAKTVAGFMNAHGGTLVIGVDDNGNPVGLDRDLATLSKSNVDGYELFLRNLLNTAVGADLCARIGIEFPLWTAPKCVSCGCRQRRGLYGSAVGNDQMCTFEAATPRSRSTVNRHTGTSLPIGGSESGATSFARGPERLRHHCARGLAGAPQA